MGCQSAGRSWCAGCRCSVVLSLCWLDGERAAGGAPCRHVERLRPAAAARQCARVADHRGWDRQAHRRRHRRLHEHAADRAHRGRGSDTHVPADGRVRRGDHGLLSGRALPTLAGGPRADDADVVRPSGRRRPQLPAPADRRFGFRRARPTPTTICLPGRPTTACAASRIAHDETRSCRSCARPSV